MLSNFKQGITVVIPAFNEEKNIELAIPNVINAVKNLTKNYEIIVVDDGSTDNTGKTVDKLARKNQKIKIINHPRNLGLGFAVKSALKAATKTHITFFPGDNDMSSGSITELIKVCDRADFVTSYFTHIRQRSFARKVLSRAFVLLMNTLFNTNLKYYNGPLICKTDLLKRVRLTSSGFTVFAEVKVRLIKAGHSYHEIPFYHTGRRYGKSKALSVRSLIQTIQTIIVLYKEVVIST